MATIESFLIAEKFEEMRLKYLSGRLHDAKQIAQNLLKFPEKLSPYEKQKAKWQIEMCEKQLARPAEL